MNVQSLYNNKCNVIQIMALSTYNIFNVVYCIHYIVIYIILKTHIDNTMQYIVLYIVVLGTGTGLTGNTDPVPVSVYRYRDFVPTGI